MKTKIFNDILSNYGITSATVRYLILLTVVDGMSLLELSETLDVDKSNTTRIINLLEKKGFVYREYNNGKTKKYKVKLTENGKILANKIKLFNDKKREEIFSCLTKEEQETLLIIMKKIITQIERMN
jgi:DNA-binding MarR family transcriptional regulator